MPDRERELEAIQYLIETINPKKMVRPPEEVHIEGGDVMLWKNYIFVGTYKGGDCKNTLLHEPIYWVYSTSRIYFQTELLKSLIW